MFLRALLAFLALPGVVALAIPSSIGARELNAGGQFQAIGLLPLAAGFALLLWCARDFHVSGNPGCPAGCCERSGQRRAKHNHTHIGPCLLAFDELVLNPERRPSAMR
jgi:hypothetical protein